jgi:pyruvate,water dikinase
VSPADQEQKVNERRQQVFDEVYANLRNKPVVGLLKAQAFKMVYEWVQRFIVVRDDERWAYEHSVLCSKVLCKELGRRLAERGILPSAEDYLMFTKDELYDMCDGEPNRVLVREKAKARWRDFHRALNHEREFPMYLRDGREVVLDSGNGEGALHGTGWTSGSVTATARVVNRLNEIDRVRPGDILVCMSTDPGWTPVFMLLGGIITETGGVLSHASLLAREYGLPSVQLSNARKLIPDGATVTLNGSTGEIVIVDSHEEAERTSAAINLG